jgi:hypothetical protein
MNVRQAQLTTGETDVDEFIFWQLELSHHRLPVRAVKAQPFLVCFHFGLRATQYYRQENRGKAHCTGDIHAFNSILSKRTNRRGAEGAELEKIRSSEFEFLNFPL